MADKPRRGRTHDNDGRPYGKWQKRFNDAEEAIARKVLGRCTLFCGDMECPAACPERTGER